MQDSKTLQYGNNLFKNTSVTSADMSNSGLPIAKSMPSLKQTTQHSQ